MGTMMKVEKDTLTIKEQVDRNPRALPAVDDEDRLLFVPYRHRIHVLGLNTLKIIIILEELTNRRIQTCIFPRINKPTIGYS